MWSLSDEPEETPLASEEIHDIPRLAIFRTLSGPSGVVPEAGLVADVAQSTWQNVTDALEPIIGTRGVDALFDRSLHLTSDTFPWLYGIREQAEIPTPLTGLRTCLAERDANTALAASLALLGTFTELLSDLIGRGLTHRLLDPVWLPMGASTIQPAQGYGR